MKREKYFPVFLFSRGQESLIISDISISPAQCPALTKINVQKRRREQFTIRA